LLTDPAFHVPMVRWFCRPSLAIAFSVMFSPARMLIDCLATGRAGRPTLPHLVTLALLRAPAASRVNRVDGLHPANQRHCASQLPRLDRNATRVARLSVVGWIVDPPKSPPLAISLLFARRSSIF
jgi:hypothetical protein